MMEQTQLWERLVILVGVFVPLWLLYELVSRLVIRFGKRFFPAWLNQVLSAFQRPLSWYLGLVGVTITLYVIPGQGGLGNWVRSMLEHVSTVIPVVCIAWGAWRAAPVCELLLNGMQSRLDRRANDTMLRFFQNLYRSVVVFIASLTILDGLGIPVTAFVTSASIAGLAITWAAQPTLSNLFAGITLVMEQPFAVGDYIVVGEYEGFVQRITFRSTQLRNRDNVLITIENSTVSNSCIQNLDVRQSRLWVCSIGLMYSTPRETVEAFCADLKEMFAADPMIDADNITIFLDEFADSCIRVTARVYIKTASYPLFLKNRGRINLKIMDVMKKNDCSFAFPSVSVYTEK